MRFRLVYNFPRLVLIYISLLLVIILMWPYIMSEPCSNANVANQTLHRLINTAPLDRFVIRVPRYDKNRRYGIIILVIGAEYEREDRDEIRRLWASQDESQIHDMRKSKVIFVVGRSSLLDEEASVFGDLLQIDIEETYRNMVYKIETSFRWLRENVKFKYVAKVDSDTVVHIDRLYEQLQWHEKIQKGDWLACYKVSDASLIRNKCSPWYISERDYSQEFFPPYCRGAGYAMKKRTFNKIIIEVEDAFFTGIAARHLDIEFKNDLIAYHYTDFSHCDIHGPSLSMLTTHNQFGVTKKKNLTAAWERLKKPYCHNFISRLAEK